MARTLGAKDKQRRKRRLIGQALLGGLGLAAAGGLGYLALKGKGGINKSSKIVNPGAKIKLNRNQANQILNKTRKVKPDIINNNDGLNELIDKMQTVKPVEHKVNINEHKKLLELNIDRINALDNLPEEEVIKTLKDPKNRDLLDLNLNQQILESNNTAEIIAKQLEKHRDLPNFYNEILPATNIALNARASEMMQKYQELGRQDLAQSFANHVNFLKQKYGLNRSNFSYFDSILNMCFLSNF